MDFYATLLSIEVTILGIIAASIFVLLQMLHSSYSYKDMLISLRGSSLLIFAITSTTVIIFTAFGLLHYAMGYHDLIPKWNLGVIDIFSNDYVLTVTLVIFMSSVGLGIVTLFANIKLLNPPTLVKKHLGELNVSSIENFLYKRYGVTEPIRPILSQIRFIGREDGEDETIDLIDKEKAEETYTDHIRKYESSQAKAKKGTDIFQSLENLFIKTISQGDRGTFKISLSDYETRIISVIEESPSDFPSQYLSQYLGESLNIYIEACRKHNQNTLTLELIRSTNRIILTLSKNTKSNEVKELLKILKENADSAIKNEDRLLFREIIDSYKEIGDSALVTENHTGSGYSNIVDEVFRHLGWLAERLITSKGIEEKPMMQDDDYEDEFEIIYNALFHFDHKYSYDYADSYPLIFFDAVHVLYDRMLEYYTTLGEHEYQREERRPEIKGWIFSSGYIFASFAREAIEKGNGDGVSLAAIRLRQVYSSAMNSGNRNVAKDFIDLIVDIAIRSASTNNDLNGKTFGSKSTIEDLEKIIIGSPFKQEIKSAVFESYIKVNEGSSDKKRVYIESLQEKLNDNFGLNFNPATGQDLNR